MSVLLFTCHKNLLTNNRATVCFKQRLLSLIYLANYCLILTLGKRQLIESFTFNIINSYQLINVTDYVAAGLNGM
jgi:hypothetical protein